MKRGVCLLSAVALAFAFASAASAQNPVQIWYGAGNGYFGNGFGRMSMYSSGHIPTPPYFSIHPPVYYSYPVPRTYGYSPYAYPEYVMTPEIEQVPAPKMFKNPHVEEKKADPKKTTKTTSTTAAVAPTLNPFVAGGTQVASRD